MVFLSANSNGPATKMKAMVSSKAMKRTIVVLAVLLLNEWLPAQPRTAKTEFEAGRVRAAKRFTTLYSLSRLSGWHMKAKAAGADCSVLVVDIGTEVTEERLETLHLGAPDPSYDISPGGSGALALDHGFRSVVYRDAADHVWVYTPYLTDVSDLRPCK
jgi:hypothetical protein